LTKEKQKPKYDIDEDKKTSEEDVDDKVDKLLGLKQLDEDNPMERAIIYDYIKRNPPKPEYMKVSTGEVETDNGNTFVVSHSKTEDVEKYMVHEPIRVVDLNTSILADISRCPSHVIPQLIDEYVKINVEEKNEFKPEKRKDIPKWGWVILLILFVPALIIVIFFLLGSL
jgi:hypothetical protein